MEITAALVKELRERTGSGMMECKKALVEAGGDIDAAIELMRKSGAAKAAKKAGRVAAEGRIVIAEDAGDDAVIVEVNSETDFVAKDEHFTEFAESVAVTVLENRPESLEALRAMELAGSGETVEALRTQVVAKIGENVDIRRFQVMHCSGDRIGAYLHGNRIGVLVDLAGGNEALARDLAMHIAASRPICIDAGDAPEEQLAKEREILTSQAAESGKPPEIVEKMVEGRMRKYLEEITLTGQGFVKDPDKRVGELLAEHGATVKAFVRYELGEGIEREATDFAAEVEAQVRQAGS